MIRILQCVNNMHRAGLETMLMNYYRNIDRTRIQFDFLTHRPERDDYDDEIEALGGRIYRAPRLYPQNYPAYFAYMKKFFREHPEYQIVHSHIDTMSYLPLLAAKKAGVPVRIAHSHSTSIDLDFKYPLKQCFRAMLPAVATYRIACGQEAGKFLYRGRDFQLIPNAIMADRYFFNPEIRELKRKELGLKDQFVVGHVGRFCYPKNHEFLLKLFSLLLQQDPDAVLMLVGTGEKESAIQAYVEELHIEDSVRFLGNRSDVNELYQAMDIFVMPSLFEGVPVVGVEAQFAGLPCLFSSRVPKEVAFSDHCAFLELDAGAAAWAEAVLQYQKQQGPRISPTNDHYDVKKASKILEEVYEKMHLQLSENH